MKSATTTTKMKGAQLWPKSTRKPFTQCKTRLHSTWQCCQYCKLSIFF